MYVCLKRVTVWYRFWISSIIGPFFIENEQGVTITVNGNRYRAMLNEFFCSQKCKSKILATFGFNRTALRAHTAEATLDVLRAVFEDRIISSRADPSPLATSGLGFDTVGLLFVGCRQI